MRQGRGERPTRSERVRHTDRQTDRHTDIKTVRDRESPSHWLV